MRTHKFYDDLPDMECISGDTLPNFIVHVTANESIEGCTMQLVLSTTRDPFTAVITKECEPIDDGFKVNLDSADTGALPEGKYYLHFVLIDTSGLTHKKLCGTLYVRAAPKVV